MTTNDTRTARECAENTGGPEPAAYHQAISAGTLELINLVDDPEMNVDLHGATPSALAQIVARPVWDAAMKFKAEPTTVTAEQIEKAAEGLATQDNRLWTVMGEIDREQYREFARAAFRAANIHVGGPTHD